MAERQDPQQQYVFTTVRIFKNDTLGTGSYGAVCKAKCDQLLCAAKLLYPVLFQMQAQDLGKEHRCPFRRFEVECQFLSRINHPNIVQYLGTYRDPETNTPVLIMELMDESLTHFLQSSPGNLPYHTQVNLSYDIAQALAFLHSNGIVHRDLSSNNVLLLASTRAKVTDFGMSKFTDLNTTRLATMTTCPGTPAFMSPEALNEPPVYIEKLDNFSFGVLLIQIVTRHFPKPTDRFEIQELISPRSNKIIRANVPVPELERRQAHIDLIPPDHPLLPTALYCLKDNDSERPTAIQLCQTLTAFKKMARYQESSQQDLHQLLREKDTILQEKNEQLLEKDEQLLANQEQLRANQEQLLEKNEQLLEKENTLAQKNEQLQANQEIIEHKDEQLLANQETLTTANMQIQATEREVNQLATRLDQATQDNHTLQHEVGAREEQLRTLHRELQSCEENFALLQQTIEQRDLEVSEMREALASKTEQLLMTRMQYIALQRQALSLRPATVGRWQSIPDAPTETGWGSSSIVIGDKTYFKSPNEAIYEFNSNQWNELTNCPTILCTLVGIDDILTTVGGKILLNDSNKLYSYKKNQWVQYFPPMPTERRHPTTVYTNNTLVVAGGTKSFYFSTMVEVLNTVNKRWSRVSPLPWKTALPSATICEDYVYIHPCTNNQEKNSVYKCSLEQLVNSKPSSSTWKRITSLPVSHSSLATVNGLLLAVGGQETKNNTSNIYQYINTAWIVVGSMTKPRSQLLTAVLPDNKLMVVGGDSTGTKCELATIEQEVRELRQALASKNEPTLTPQMHEITLQDEKQTPSTNNATKLVTVERWHSQPDVPISMSGFTVSSTVIGGEAYFAVVYFTSLKENVYKFSNSEWNELTSCLKCYCTIVSVDNILTIVGGRNKKTVQLHRQPMG